MNMLQRAVPATLAGLWCGVIAIGLALAAMAATEPPVWDALSYVQKAYAFWQSVAAGEPFNPFNLPMTIRPPGTILMSYPFGWSDDFRWFYFRSCFIPIALLVVAVYLAGWSRYLTPRGHWLLAGLALSLGGMPILYQFQANDSLPLVANWGLVDGFMAGVCGVTAAAAWRSVSARSVHRAWIAAAAAGFSLWVKPSGLLVVALCGLVWLTLLGFSAGWKAATFQRDAGLRRFAGWSIGGAGVIFAVFVGLAVGTDYFSADNVAFGRRALDVLYAESASPGAGAILTSLTRNGFGYVVPLLMALAVAVGVGSRFAHGPVTAAFLCLGGGLWFWLGETDASQVRYFLPFGVMAYILLIPPLLTWAQSLRPAIAYTGAAAAVIPTLVVTGMLFVPNPPDRWQRALGINLHVSEYRPENEQAADLLNRLQADGTKTSIVYLSSTTAPGRNLEAVWDYSTVARPAMPKITTLLSVDWQHPSTLRAEDILQSNFIAADVIGDAAARNTILGRRTVRDFSELTELINAWVSGLNETDGVRLVSETRIRLLRIADRGRFEAAFTRLEETYDLPQSYRDANPQRWWSAAELAARNVGQTLVASDVAFHAEAASIPVRWVRAAEFTQTVDGLRATFWLESGAGDAVEGPWYLFTHMIDRGGNIVANTQAALVPGAGPSPDRTIRRYALTFPTRPPEAAALAFGFYVPNGANSKFLVSDHGNRDWENRRLIVPLPNAR